MQLSNAMTRSYEPIEQVYGYPPLIEASFALLSLFVLFYSLKDSVIELVIGKHFDIDCNKKYYILYFFKKLSLKTLLHLRSEKQLRKALEINPKFYWKTIFGLTINKRNSVSKFQKYNSKQNFLF